MGPKGNSFSGLRAFLGKIGMGLLFVALCVGGMSVKNCLTQRPADAYEDKGVYTFIPKNVYPVQVESSGVGRQKRRNPTRTVYKVYYQTQESSGYQWTVEAVSKSDGQRKLKEKEPVKRRVLSIVEEGTYITIEPGQTAESYVAESRRTYIKLWVASAAYILFFVGCMAMRKRK